MDVLKKVPVREQDAAARAKILTRYVLDIIKKKRSRKRRAASTAKTQSVFRAVL